MCIVMFLLTNALVFVVVGTNFLWTTATVILIPMIVNGIYIPRHISDFKWIHFRIQ